MPGPVDERRVLPASTAESTYRQERGTHPLAIAKAQRDGTHGVKPGTTPAGQPSSPNPSADFAGATEGISSCLHVILPTNLPTNLPKSRLDTAAAIAADRTPLAR